MKYALNTAEHAINWLITFIRKALSLRRPKVVISYLSYGRHDNDLSKVRIFGRVVEESKPFEFSHSTNRLVHFFQVVKLFITRKVPNAEVTVSLEDRQFHIRCNEEGFFSQIFEAESTDISSQTNQALLNFHLISKKRKKTLTRSFSGRFVTPTPETHCLIVSDIDDTVIKSQATSFFRLAFKTLFYPVSQRQTFTEASRVYQSLKRGKTGRSNNLVFYVSSSTWNLYPLLQGFLEINEFPEGPVILQDIASERKKNPLDHHNHKLDRILEIANFYPEFPLILIGDAGQQDPELYLKAAKQLPNRVQIILIRQSWWTKAVKDNTSYLRQAKQLDIQMIYFDDLSELNEELQEFMVTD